MFANSNTYAVSFYIILLSIFDINRYFQHIYTNHFKRCTMHLFTPFHHSIGGTSTDILLVDRLNSPLVPCVPNTPYNL